MAIDAATIDTAAAAQRPVLRERPASPIINDGHNSRGVEIKGEMSFGDFLDIINPLQHIPIVGNIYREITGDTIKPSSKVIGGILYGGPIGGMASIANAVVEEAQGKDFGDQIMASLGFGGGDHTAPDAPTAVAAKPDQSNLNGANPASAAAVAAAQAAAPQVTAADKAVRLTASAEPPAGAQTATKGTTRDALAAGPAPHPTRMPPRDTPLANSMMAKHAAPKFAAPMHGATLVHGQAAASGQAGSSAGPAAAAGQGGSAAATAAGSAGAGSAGAGSAGAGSAAKATGGLMLEAQDGAAPNVMTPVSPDMLSETMMRNLAKYEQSRKAAQSAAPSLRVSG